MRLLYLSADPGVPVLGHKGASVHVREMVAALSGLGARVTVASPRVGPEGDELESPAQLGESGVRVAEELDLPHVLEVNAPLCEEARRFRVLPHPEEAVRIEARVLAATDRVFVVSAALAERLADDGIDATRISVTPNAIDPAKFGLRRRSRADRTFTIGFAGSLKPWHGIDVL